MRYLTEWVAKDLKKKMVFIGGPRQAGKTTLAKSFLKDNAGQYFNWDRDLDKKRLLSEDWNDEDDLLIFDEIHKFRRWKNWVKGIYDTQKEVHRILVTGSARLDVYRQGGDSLMGRYHYWRLHPFSLSEIPENISKAEAFKRLMSVGGFPEPFLENDERAARRWRRERLEKVIREDIRDVEGVRDLQTLGLLVELLRSRVGGPVVISNLAEDLHVSSPTVAKWIDVLERMYVIFTVRPYTKNLPRALQKPPKIYFFDNSDVDGDEGARLENLVATHLLKHIHYLSDRDGFRYELRYVRDKEKREVDFAIIKERELEDLIEVKWSDEAVSPSLTYFSERLRPKRSTQIVGKLNRRFSKNGVSVSSPLDSEHLCSLEMTDRR